MLNCISISCMSCNRQSHIATIVTFCNYCWITSSFILIQNEYMDDNGLVVQHICVLTTKDFRKIHMQHCFNLRVGQNLHLHVYQMFMWGFVTSSLCVEWTICNIASWTHLWEVKWSFALMIRRLYSMRNGVYFSSGLLLGDKIIPSQRLSGKYEDCLMFSSMWVITIK